MRSVSAAALLLSSVASVATATGGFVKRSSIEPYAPYTTSCPSGSLVRKATSINSQEAEYIKNRAVEADKGLLEFLGEAWECYTAELRDLPKLGIALSGGGAKGALVTLGVLNAFDGREDGDSSVSGVLQAATYITALSGGTLGLSAILGSNFSLPSTMYNNFFFKTEQNALGAALGDITQIGYDVSNKTIAGYPATIADIYGRVIAFSFFAPPPDGDDGLTLSSLINTPTFQDYDFAFPIYALSESDVAAGQCTTTDLAVWEVSPYEWGSWESPVDAFYPTLYMGTSSNATSGQCTTNYDNLGYITGASSNILINATSCAPFNETIEQLNALAGPIYLTFPAQRLINPYNIVPNPFAGNADVGSAVKTQENLYFADGGFTGQVVPIFPLIQEERNVDVIILVDTETSNTGNITDGTSVYNSYLAAMKNGLTKMPIVPSPAQFAAQNLSQHPSFYGCYNESTTTLIFLPDTEATVPSIFAYTPAQVQQTYTAGYDQATYANNTEWAGCLACAIMHKSPWELPDLCEGCLSKYCWTP